MRVVAGKYRGLNVKSPKGSKFRPTENRVKEAIFDMLHPIKNGGTALDLFACTGQIGIEFLSRGCDFVVFNEINYFNFRTLKDNLEKLKDEETKVYKGDFRPCLEDLHKKGLSFDYIFLDPPYKEDYVEDSLKLILKYDLLRKDGIIITEMEKKIDFTKEFPLKTIKEKTYGKKEVKFYKKI